MFHQTLSRDTNAFLAGSMRNPGPLLEKSWGLSCPVCQQVSAVVGLFGITLAMHYDLADIAAHRDVIRSSWVWCVAQIGALLPWPRAHMPIIVATWCACDKCYRDFVQAPNAIHNGLNELHA